MCRYTKVKSVERNGGVGSGGKCFWEKKFETKSKRIESGLRQMKIK